MLVLNYIKAIDFNYVMKENGVLLGGVPERSKGSDCKSDGSAFEGSNPSPSTNDQMNKRFSPCCGLAGRV